MDIKFERVNVTNKSILSELYNNSALTMEGLSENNIINFLEWINEYTKTLDSLKVYIIKGSVMNELYELTECNLYNDELNIVCVKLSDMEDFNKIVLPKFEVKARWFDDIVDNNKKR